MPTRNIKRTYIGGNTSEARKKYFNLDKELTQVVTNLATNYGISPALVIDRLAHEGIIDRLINDHNTHVQRGGEERPSRAFSTNAFNSPYGLFGLDYIFDTYTKGITKTKRPINFRKLTTTNESGDIIHSGETNNVYDTLELFTAELASRREQVKKQYPNLTDSELDSATAARYNATNRYFKQLMDSGEYKTKYPIDLEGVNIPSPTKTDSKYIQNQTYTVNMDRVFRMAPQETFVYKDKSWNPNLFMTNGYIDEPESPMVKRFLNNYAIQNFTQPNKVNFIQKKYKCGGRRKARLGLEDNNVPTQEEYIAQRIAAKRAAALDKSRNRTMPAIPIIDGRPNRNSCIYTATDNYGNQYRVPGNWTFYENPGKYGFKPVSLDQAVPGDIIQVFDKGTPYHAMTLDSFDEQGRMKYNYSRGYSGDESDIVKASINFPNTKKAAYTFVGTAADSTQWINEYKQRYGNTMRCGGRRKAQLGLDIREGGIAIPIANNMFYIDGRKHAAGGVAIGPNNKNGVEVEGGEVVEMIDSNHPSVGRQFKSGGQQQTMRVFSSVPFLRGASPAELVLGGANPDAVFKAQEEFKDRNRINDDGTTYEMGGEGKPKSKYSRPVKGVLPYGYAIRNLYAVENPYRKGIKGNVAKMYDNRTLGAGVDVVSGHPELYKKAKSGKMTKKQADETAVIHLRKDDNAIRSNYADVYGKAAADTLSYGPRFLVAQARYQQGNVRKAWKPIHKAMAKGDAKALKKAVLQVTPKDHDYRRKWIEDFKVYKMGGMIYEINGNVKNGLMSVRPKAEWGKGKDDEKWKFVSDPENFVRGYRINTPYGKLYSDGTSYLDANGEITWHTSPKFMDKAIKYQVNKRPQYYAEKRLPIAGGQSIAEKAGLARSGWNYADSPTFDYVPSINISVPINYAKVVGDNSKKSTGSTARGGRTQSTATSRGTAKVESPKPATSTNPNEARYASRVQKGQAQEVTTQPAVEYNEAADKNPDKNRYTRAAGFKNGNVSASPGNNQKTKNDEKDKDERLIPQFKPINTGDWIGLSSNLAGHIASYFINNNLLNKYPMPTKPALYQADKLKTTHNINPKLATSRETEQMNLAEVGRNTSSSSTSIARKQRIMNEARDARNKLYGEKENIETQLINLDKRNRQDVFNRNIAAFNDWLDKTYIAKTNKLLEKQKNMMSLINGIPGAVNHTLGVIETRRNANNAYKAIAAANPNVDGRLLGIGDYYVGEKTKKKYDKFGNLIS